MTSPWPRAVLHVDMDAFFAAIEQRDRPELRGKPLLIGHDGPRGVVATASYEARPFGCRSAMPMVTAKRLCPQAIVVGGGFHRYRAVSEELFAILERFSPLVQPVSIDEAYLDLTGMEAIAGSPAGQARQLKDAIREGLHLTASVGVGPNKLIAKLASEHGKPDGLVVVPPEQAADWIEPMSLERLPGIGPKSVPRLKELGLGTVGDLRSAGKARLVDLLGAHGEDLWDRAHARDDRPVQPDRQAKSISHEQTFSEDLRAADQVRTVLLGLCERVGFRLRRHGLLAGGVSVKIRFGDFQTVSRGRSLGDQPTDLTDELWREARALFDTWASAGFRPVRLIGVGATHLRDRGQQLELFPDPQRRKRAQVDGLVDAVTERFGKGAIRRGGPR